MQAAQLDCCKWCDARCRLAAARALVHILVILHFRISLLSSGFAKLDSLHKELATAKCSGIPGIPVIRIQSPFTCILALRVLPIFSPLCFLSKRALAALRPAAPVQAMPALDLPESAALAETLVVKNGGCALQRQEKEPVGRRYLLSATLPFTF
jgi:hypothetical protein